MLRKEWGILALKELPNFYSNLRNDITPDVPNGFVQKSNNLIDFGEIIDAVHNRKLCLLTVQMGNSRQEFVRSEENEG